MLLMVISLMIFGIPLVMLNINRTIDGEDEVIHEVSKFWMPNMVLNQYLLALGEFQIDEFELGSQSGLCYMFFVMATLIS